MKKWLVAAAAALAPAWALSQILVGQTAGFSGPVAAGVKETTDGARLWIDSVNAKGGVNGQKIELLSMDDKFEPKLAAANAKVLVEEKNVAVMFLTRGTPHTEAMLPLLEATGTPLVAPSTGAMVLHRPVRKYVFNVRATYQHEAEKAVVHLHTQGITRIAVVHADDSFGADALEGAEKGFKQEGFQPVAVVKANRAKPDYTRIVPAIVGPDAQAVLWIGSGTAVIDGVKALRAAGSGAQVVTLSNNASKGFIKGLGPVGRGVIVTQVFPDEHSFAYGFIKEAIGLAKEKHLALSPAMLEGFAGARVLVEALRRAGPNPTRQKIETALEGMKKFDIGGMEVSYSPEHHTGVEFADLSIISGDGRFIR